MCNFLDDRMTLISNIKQATQLTSDGKLSYFSVKDSKLKLRVQANGNKDWVVRYSINVSGKRKQLTETLANFQIDQKIDELKILAALLLNEKQTSVEQLEGEVNKKPATFDDVWAEYTADDYILNVSSTQLQKKYSFERYKTFFENCGKFELASITAADVSRFKSSRNHVRTACNRDLSHMSHFFDFAKSKEYIAENPALKIGKFPEFKGTDGLDLNQLDWFFEMLDRYPRLYDETTRQPIIGSDGQQVYDEHKKIVANFAKFLVLTGLRVSEASKLIFLPVKDQNYISQELCTITNTYKIFVTLNQHKSVKKNGKRKVQLMKSALECLRLLPPFTPRKIASNGRWVFPNQRNNGPITRKSIDKFINDLNDSIDIYGGHERITMRSLRHTFARRALSHNITHDELANILGHTSTDMIRKHYATNDTEQTSYAVNQLERNIQKREANAGKN